MKIVDTHQQNGNGGHQKHSMTFTKHFIAAASYSYHTSQNNVGQLGAKTQCPIKMEEITTKAMLKNSRIINI